MNPTDPDARSVESARLLLLPTQDRDHEVLVASLLHVVANLRPHAQRAAA